jgi:5'-methylthioadenosine phosphorylase
MSYAIIGGTGLLHEATSGGVSAPDGIAVASSVTVSTPHGDVVVWPLAGGTGYLLQRHGAGRYVQPHAIPHKAHMTALQQLGVRRIMAFGSVGSLHVSLPPGSVVVPDDLYAPHVHDSFWSDARGHRCMEFDAGWRLQVLSCLQSHGGALTPPVQVVARGVYWQTHGPRFETMAEIRFHQPVADVVGMTIASEALLAGELGLAYAAVCLVDNYANGVAPVPVTLAALHAQVARNRPVLLGLVALLRRYLLEEQHEETGGAV